MLAGLRLDALLAFFALMRSRLPSAASARLLFRASVHGKNAAAFHRECDNKGPTVVLIRDTAGNVFGGHAPVHWASGGVGVSCPTAFLFSVVNPHGDLPAVFESKGDGCSIVRYSDYGPAFGAGGHICVSGAFDDSSWTDIDGDSYHRPATRQAQTLFTGAKYFTPEEVEVWAV